MKYMKMLKKYLKMEMKKMNNYFINIYDKIKNKSWKEEFDSEYLFRKRLTKLKYSQKLVVTSKSLFRV